jgi:hypothetical protein
MGLQRQTYYSLIEIGPESATYGQRQLRGMGKISRVNRSRTEYSHSSLAAAGECVESPFALSRTLLLRRWHYRLAKVVTRPDGGVNKIRLISVCRATEMV